MGILAHKEKVTATDTRVTISMCDETLYCKVDKRTRIKKEGEGHVAGSEDGATARGSRLRPSSCASLKRPPH